MKLEEMTNAQLVNIILRKDDVETRLRAEIATLKKENKRIGRVCWAKTIGICLLFAAFCIASFTLASCGNSNQCNHRKDCLDTITAIDSNHSQVINRCSMQDWGFEAEYDTISFFGEPVILDDSTHIMQQITEIVERDTMLSITGRVLTVGQVGFGINIHSGYLSLLSSTQVDDPKIKEVLEYLNSIYGAPEENEPDDYWWYVGADEDYPGRLVARMRPLHSEEGGTVLFFE